MVERDKVGESKSHLIFFSLDIFCLCWPPANHVSDNPDLHLPFIRDFISSLILFDSAFALLENSGISC